MTAYSPYLPLNVLKPVADDLWVVDGPEIHMQYFGMRLPFPTRMTVVRLQSGEIWIHSPIAWCAELANSIRELGPVCFLVAPSTLHYWYVPEWQPHFPAARTYGPAGLERSARRKIRVDEALEPAAPDVWSQALDQCVVSSRLFTEVDFFHRPSRTLILTDLIENFEPGRVRSPWLRLVMKAFGAADPDGKAPYDMQFSFIGRRGALREAVARMIDWAPERVIMAHGRCYTSDGVDEIRRAFRWVL